MTDLLPDIPRWYTGLAEWGAALVYISMMRRRLTSWRFLIVVAAALPIFIVLQETAGLLPVGLWMVGMAASTLMMFAFVALTCELSVRDSGYVTVRAFVLAELVASLQWQLWVHWVPEEPTVELGTGRFISAMILLVVCYSACFFVAHRVERRNIRPRERLGVSQRALVSSIAIGLATFFVSNMSFVITSTPFSGTNPMDIFYIRTLVDLAGFVALYTQQGHRNETQRAMELAETSLLMQLQHEQYLQSKRNIGELNRMHHDLRYYVAAIRAEESADRRSEYLSELESSIRGYESEIKTGNGALDIILSAKMEKCLQEEISMTHVIDGEAVAFIDLPRLSALFGNAIDNAIEACRQIEDIDQRILKVSVFTRSGFVMIRIENYWEGEVEFVRGLPRTTKANRERHGFGTQSMRRIAEDLSGSISFRHEDSWFQVRVLIPQPRG
ncbi:MAG TPA: GHKL domain-containing protein [Candidatus Agrococcus pullicola]|uniref:GHKL domain-containing protein n=1 Tax=Candidatus Agrococcus pullicola TaxID=2838429 RepID=A0A9D1YZ23_9MICO|nr:GHKL domain-containing protein [Candidatus Agrococcus pullicola]